jgi:DNA-binding NarL/FixJ family response regulator
VIRVLLVDDQPLLRQGFGLVLAGEDDLLVVGEAGDGLEAVRMARMTRPDVVLMDVRMPRADGIEATREIVRQVPAARVLILTTFDLDEYAFSGLAAGASGFLLKDVAPADLVSGIRSVARGDAVVAPRITRRLLEEFATGLARASTPESAPDGLAELTVREREVFDHMAGGRSNAEIALALVLSEATVKTHVGRVLAKLGLRDRVQAVILAYESGLIAPTSSPGTDQAPAHRPARTGPLGAEPTRNLE